MNQDLHEVTGAEAPKLSPLQILRHSTAQVITAAVKRLFPEATVTLVPAIDTGFHYDLDLLRPFAGEAVAAIEAEMQKIVDAKVTFEALDSGGARCRAPHLRSTREIGAFKLLALEGVAHLGAPGTQP